MRFNEADFAKEYAQMSDDGLERVAADEASLVPEAVLALHAELVRRPEIVRKEPIRPATPQPRHPLFGVGGWLLLYCIGCFVGVVVDPLPTPAGIRISAIGSAFIFLISFVLRSLNLVAGICIARKAKLTLRVVAAQLSVRAACLIFFVFGAFGLLVRSSSLPNETLDAAGWMLAESIALAAWLFTWFRYFKTSVRVRITLGRNL